MSEGEEGVTVTFLNAGSFSITIKFLMNGASFQTKVILVDYYALKAGLAKAYDTEKEN